MKLVYIAGKYRADTPWEVEQNIRAAEAVGLEVAKLGLVPVIPHTMYRYFDGQQTGQYWIDATLRLMERCDVVLMLPGWGASEGSCGEYDRAVELGIPVVNGDCGQTVMFEVLISTAIKTESHSPIDRIRVFMDWLGRLNESDPWDWLDGDDPDVAATGISYVMRRASKFFERFTQ